MAGGALLDIGVYALSFVRWFMTSQPTEMVSQVKLAPTGVDEQAGILLTNVEGEMATVTLSLHAKQPKRGTIAMTRAISNFMSTHVGKKRSSLIRKMAHKKSSKQEKPLKPSSMRSLDMEAAVAGEDDYTYLQLQPEMSGTHDTNP